MRVSVSRLLSKVLTAALLLSAAIAAGPAASAQAATPVPVVDVNPWLDRELTRDELLPVAAQSGDYLLRNQLADGQFIYIKDPLGKCCAGKGDKYSLVRHLGAVYALLRLFEVSGDERYLAGARLGIDFAARWRTRAGDLEIVRSQDGSATLGENGFLLITAVLHDHLTRSGKYREMADGLAAWLVASLTYGGRYSTKGQWAECQAVIGLALHHRLVRQDPATIGAARAWLTAMTAAGRHSHWSAQAVWWTEWADPGRAPGLAVQALASGRKLLDGVRQRTGDDRSQWVGSRSGKHGSCGATARNEGLLALHHLARATGDADSARFYLDRAREHIAYALQFQYGLAGGLADREPRLPRVSRLFDLKGGVFNTAATSYIRIDYVSHHLRAIWSWLSSPAIPPSTGLSMQDLMPGGRTRRGTSH